MFILLFGFFIVWLFVPIVGIFPFLLWIQLKLLSTKKEIKKKNLIIINILLAIVIFSVTIYCSAITVYGDTQTYIRDYQELNFIQIFNFHSSPMGKLGLYGGGKEMFLFILSYPIKIISNNSPYFFLINQSLIINVLTVLVAKKLSKKYYPLLLIIVFSSGAYYQQVFVMRHFLSNVFLMLAIVNIKSIKRTLIFSIFSFSSHQSSLFYLLFIIYISINFNNNKSILKRENNNNFNHFYNYYAFNDLDYNFSKKNNIKNSKDKIKINKGKVLKIIITFLLVIFLGILSFNFPLIIQVIEKTNGIFLIDSISDRALRYINESLYSDVYSGAIFPISATFLIIGIILIRTKEMKTYPHITPLLLIMSTQIPAALFFPGGMRFRFAFIILSYQGLFYSILTNNGHNKFIKTLPWMYASLSFIGFLYQLHNMPNYPSTGGSLVFFQGDVFSKNVIDYISLLLRGTIITE